MTNRISLALWLILVATPVAAQTDDPHTTLFRASMVAAIAAHGADLAETEHCLGAQRCNELNPWLARFNQPSAFGAAKMGVAALQLWLVAKMHELFPKAAIAINFASAVVFSAVAAHNSAVARR